MGLNFSGANELSEDLSTLAQSLSDASKRDIVLKAAEPIRQEMASSAPGSIGTAIKAKASGKSGKVTIGVHRSDWSGSVYYPPFVEFGHAGPHPAPPHPFLRPAFDANVETVFKTMKEELLRALDGNK